MYESRMYIARPLLADPRWSRDLNQGDIIKHLLVPMPATEKTLCLRLSGKAVSGSASPDDVRAANPMLRVVLKLEVEPFALVLSNSCDNSTGDTPVLVCPIKPLPLREEGDAKRWREISVAATGTANPKRFYLPAHPHFDLPRSAAHFPMLQTLEHDFITRCVQQREACQRIGGLSPEAVRHLQRGLDVYFARNPRDDYDWPSREDLEIKAAALRAQVESGRDREAAQAELDLIDAELAEH